MEKNNKKVYLMFFFMVLVLCSCQQEYCLTLEGNYNKWGVEGGLTYCTVKNSEGTAKFVDENGKESYLVPAETLNSVVEKLESKETAQAKQIKARQSENPFQKLCDQLGE